MREREGTKQHNQHPVTLSSVPLISAGEVPQVTATESCWPGTLRRPKESIEITIAEATHNNAACKQLQCIKGSLGHVLTALRGPASSWSGASNRVFIAEKCLLTYMDQGPSLNTP